MSYSGNSNLQILSYSDYTGYGKDFGASVKRIENSPFVDTIAWNNIKEILPTVIRVWLLRTFPR